MIIRRLIRGVARRPASIQEISRDYATLFEGHEDGRGRRVLADILAAGGVFRHTEPDADPIALARAEGRREMALMILHKAKVDPRALLDLVGYDSGLTHGNSYYDDSGDDDA